MNYITVSKIRITSKDLGLKCALVLKCLMQGFGREWKAALSLPEKVIEK